MDWRRPSLWGLKQYSSYVFNGMRRYASIESGDNDLLFWILRLGDAGCIIRYIYIYIWCQRLFVLLGVPFSTSGRALHRQNPELAAPSPNIHILICVIMCIYIYIYVCICIYIYIYIYTSWRIWESAETGWGAARVQMELITS